MKTKDNRNHKNYTYEQIRKIQNIFIDNKQNIDVKGTIEYFDKVYVRQLSKFTNIDNKTLCDCACGYGWFSFAYLLNGENNKAIGIDIDMKKIEIAKYISEILELSDRVRFKNANITQLPLNSNSIDIFASIETLEHVGDKGDQLLRILARKQKKEGIKDLFKMQSNLQLKALMEIKRVTSEAVVISTPNRYYLKDNHDTGLKFVHWMPRYFGIKYSMKFWKGEPFHQSLHCRFLSHYEVEKILSDFKLVTPLLCFSDINEYLQIFPVYCPYGGGWLTGISKAKLNLLKLIFPILGEKSRYFLPSIQGIYIRQKNIENVY